MPPYVVRRSRSSTRLCSASPRCNAAKASSPYTGKGAGGAKTWRYGKGFPRAHDEERDFWHVAYSFLDRELRYTVLAGKPFDVPCLMGHRFGRQEISLYRRETLCDTVYSCLKAPRSRKEEGILAAMKMVHLSFINEEQWNLQTAGRRTSFGQARL